MFESQYRFSVNVDRNVLQTLDEIKSTEFFLINKDSTKCLGTFSISLIQNPLRNGNGYPGFKSSPTLDRSNLPHVTGMHSMNIPESSNRYQSTSSPSSGHIEAVPKPTPRDPWDDTEAERKRSLELQKFQSYYIKTPPVNQCTNKPATHVLGQSRAFDQRIAAPSFQHPMEMTSNLNPQRYLPRQPKAPRTLTNSQISLAEQISHLPVLKIPPSRLTPTQQPVSAFNRLPVISESQSMKPTNLTCHSSSNTAMKTEMSESPKPGPNSSKILNPVVFAFPTATEIPGMQASTNIKVEVMDDEVVETLRPEAITSTTDSSPKHACKFSI